MYAAELLLKNDYKNRDSTINRWKSQTVNRNKHHLADVPNANKWPSHQKDRYIRFEQGKKVVLAKLKASLAADIKALSIDLLKVPYFYSTVQVYGQAPAYLTEKYTEIEKIFSLKLNSEPIREHFFFKQGWFNYLEYRQSLSNYYERVKMYEKRSVSLVEEASDEATALIQNQNLVAYVNFKNSGQPTYQHRYKEFTGREPKMPNDSNPHKLAGIDPGFLNATSENEENV